MLAYSEQSSWNCLHVVPDLKEADVTKGGLHWLHLRILREKHMLDSRLTVVQRTVPRNVIAATESVFCYRKNNLSDWFANFQESYMLKFILVWWLHI